MNGFKNNLNMDNDKINCFEDYLRFDCDDERLIKIARIGSYYTIPKEVQDVLDDHFNGWTIVNKIIIVQKCAIEVLCERMKAYSPHIE